MKKNNENTNAFLIHISAFAGFLFPFGNIITPLIAWQTLKDRSLYLDEQGKEAVNFNISYSLYLFILTIFAGSFFIGDFFYVTENVFERISHRVSRCTRTRFSMRREKKTYTCIVPRATTSLTTSPLPNES